jgi:hypothetical protein
MQNRVESLRRIKEPISKAYPKPQTASCKISSKLGSVGSPPVPPPPLQMACSLRVFVSGSAYHCMMDTVNRAEQELANQPAQNHLHPNTTQPWAVYVPPANHLITTTS